MTRAKSALVVKVLLVALRNGPPNVSFPLRRRSRKRVLELAAVTRVLVFRVLPLRVMRGLVVVLLKEELSLTLRKLRAIVKVLPESVRRGPFRVKVAGPGVPGLTVPTSLKLTRLPPMSKVLSVSWKRAVVPELSSFPVSAKNRNEQQEVVTWKLLKLLKVLFVALSSGPARLTVLGVAPDRRKLRNAPEVLRVLWLKVISGSDPLLLSVELFPTKSKDLRFRSGSPVVILLLFVASKSGPDKVRVDPELVELDKLTKVRSASTVLPLKVMRGLVVVLVNVAPSRNLKKREPILKVLPISLRSFPVRLTFTPDLTRIRLSLTLSVSLLSWKKDDRLLVVSDPNIKGSVEANDEGRMPPPSKIAIWTESDSNVFETVPPPELGAGSSDAASTTGVRPCSIAV